MHHRPRGWTPLMQEASDALAVIIKLETHKLSKKLGITFLPHDLAPSTYAEAVTEFKMAVYSGLPYRVAAANCDTAIFTDETTNLQLRFWHDSVHVLEGHDFTSTGERDSARVHMKVLAKGYSVSSTSLAGRLMWIDCNGQYRCLEEIGVFPSDQLHFATNAMRKGLKAAIDVERLVQRLSLDS